MVKSLYHLVLLALWYTSRVDSSKMVKAGHFFGAKIDQKKLCTIALSAFFSFITLQPSHAGMLTFPLPAPLKNNYYLMRSAECYADSRHEIQTNPVKKLRQDNALTINGQEQAKSAALKLTEQDFIPSFIWTSNTERAYETAAVVAREIQLGQNRIIPEYSFLDARAAGVYEGADAESSWAKIHELDQKEGIKYKPPPNTDGTPTESVSDVLVRANQLVSTVESMYSGENVLVISPDSEVLSVLQAALSDTSPDESLPQHFRFTFQNGEIRKLSPAVKPPTLLVTGQTVEEAESSARKMKAIRVGGTVNRALLERAETWEDLWHLGVDARI